MSCPACLPRRAGPALALILALPGLVLLQACGGGSATLLEIGPQTVEVNQELRLTIGIDNPAGVAVGLRVEDPMLPSFDRVTSVSASPSGAVFRWAPLSSQTGTHTLTFVLTDGGSGVYDTQDVLVTVNASEDAAPIFVRPGAGQTFDLERDPCVSFDIEVRDDDSESVSIGSRSELPDRATLINAGPKQATFDWCPTPDQAASKERWTIELFATDDEHPRVEHDYVIVLRSGPKDGCPGTAPVINLLGPQMDQIVTSGSAFPIEVEVTDDRGLRDPPLLYYTTSPPDDLTSPDVTQFQQTSFEASGGDTYVARITNLGLEEGESVDVYYLVSATDNDDESGAACDHRTDSPVVGFLAEGGVPPDGSLRQCDFCSASTECESGICATTASGGRCVDACGDAECSAGSCGATVTTEGGTRAGCGPVRTICGGGGGGECTDDGNEPNDSIGAATTLTGAGANGQICDGNEDFYRLDLDAGDAITVDVDFTHLDGDLDLELLSQSGMILATSAGVRDRESATYCNSGGATAIYARVFGFEGQQNAYSISASVASCGGSCTEDRNEPNDTQGGARRLTLAGGSADFSGQICPGNDDWYSVTLDSPGTIEALVTFTHASGDIDIELYAPGGARVAQSLGVDDEEQLEHRAASAGAYALRVFGYTDGNAYDGLVTVTAGASCGATSDCPVGTVCSAGSCEDDACTGGGDCPGSHSCVQTGPPPAGRQCGFTCSGNTQCRSSEGCKWTADGRVCGLRGGGANGDSCATMEGCGAQRTCVDWPGGYCARQGCSSNTDCEADTRCVRIGSRNVCAVRCVSAPCRESEGYSCQILPNMGDSDRFVCAPRP